MKSVKLLVLCAIILAGAECALAQSELNLSAGFKPYGSYHGTVVDTVDVLNGNVTVHVPFPASYPQRGGKLQDTNLLLFHSKSWRLVPDPNSTGGLWAVNRSPIGATDNLHPVHTRTLYQTTFAGKTLQTVGNDALVTWDGATHKLMDVSNGKQTAFEAIDGSGWHVSVSNPNQYGVPQSGIITDREGTQYTIAYYGPVFGSPCSGVQGGIAPAGGRAPMLYPNNPGAFPNATAFSCQTAGMVEAVVDANGNTINMPLNAAWTGTMGTTGAYFDDYGVQLNTGPAPAGCGSSTSYIGYGTTSYPGPNGTMNQILECFSGVTIQTHFDVAGDGECPNGYCGVSPTTPTTFLSSIVLPDGSSWTFNYDSYGNVTYIGLPLGGSVSYQYVTVPFPTPASGSTPVSRAVSQRTIADNNGNSYIWKYQWITSQSNPLSANGTYTNVVTDPEGNDSVHTFTDLLAGPAFYETTTQFYQGSYTSGQLLKQVVTGYQATQVGDTKEGYGVTVLPNSIQTKVYPSGKVNQVQKTYDTALTDPTSGATSYGKVVTEKEYDWGPASPGPLLRETDTTYEWQVNSAYLTAHFLDLPASVVVKDGSGCAVAETDYTYDESAYLTGANITTQHASPPGAVRGEPTTVTKWLGPGTACNPKGGTKVVSHANWYDTGELYQQIDPLGHTTTHSYDTAYVGALSTQTCNALSQCVSGTYDFTTGLLTSFTDANATSQASGNTAGDPAHTINYAYDFMSRLTSATFPPDPSKAQANTTFAYPNPIMLPFTVTKTKSVTASLTDSVTNTYDGLGRIYKTQHTLPAGTAEVDTGYDGLDHVTSVTNAYFSTSDPTYGVVHSQYDALGRATTITEQDGSVKSVAYNVKPILAAPGDCTQSTDEAGKQRMTCADGLGRLIEVHEPGDTFSGSQAGGAISISGSLQNYVNPGANATPGKGSVTIAGSEQSQSGGMYCAAYDSNGNCVDWEPNPPFYDGGTVTITVNGHSDSYGYGANDAADTVATGLASAINADGGAAVTATSSGSTVKFDLKGEWLGLELFTLVFLYLGHSRLQ